MQKPLFILFFFVCFTTVGQTQTVTQTYIDRCTNETKIVVANFVNDQATVAFYNRIKTFTWVEYTNGTLQTWLNETYNWWANLSPCSTNTATNQSAQQTSQNAASNASSAASNATSGSTNTSNTNASSTNSSTSNSSSSSSSSSSNSSSNNDSAGGGDGQSSNSSSESEGNSGSESESNSNGGEEEGNSSGDSEEDSSNSSSEESSEEESDSESEEVEEESKEEEKKEEKKEKQKKRNPIAVAANLMSQSALDGTISQVASFGFSQSSLTGTTTYSANLMVWDNLQQFSLNLSRSDVYFNYDREEKLYLYNPKTKKEDLYFATIHHKGSIMVIQSVSTSFMYMYGTKVASFGLSNVYLGQKENFWKGFVGGFALSGTVINVDDIIIVMPTGVLFGTKPFPTKRVTISPMLALALNPVTYTFSTKEAVFKGDLVFNKHVTYIVGSNFDVGLTQRFRFNIGGNIVGTTLPGTPLTYSITIGSKFQF